MSKVLFDGFLFLHRISWQWDEDVCNQRRYCGFILSHKWTGWTLFFKIWQIKKIEFKNLAQIYFISPQCFCLSRRPLIRWSKHLGDWNVRNCQNTSWKEPLELPPPSMTTKVATQEINQNHLFLKRVHVKGCHRYSCGSFSSAPTAEHQRGSGVSPQRRRVEIVMSGVESYFHFFWLVAIKPTFSVHN